MATNLALDPDLLDRAVRVSGGQTRKAAVLRAFQEFIARREQCRVAELFGTLLKDRPQSSRQVSCSKNCSRASPGQRHVPS